MTTQPPNEPADHYKQADQVIHGYQTNIAGDVNTDGGIFNTGTINAERVIGSIHYDAPRPATIPRVLPIIDISHFTGRSPELARMATLLLATPRTPIIGIWGGPGVGKSALTRYFAEKHADQFPAGIISLDARDKSADALAAHFAAIVGEPVDEEYEFDAGPIMQTRFAQRRILLILDNVTRPDVRFLAPGGQAVLIVTTRDRGLLDLLSIPSEAQIAVPYFGPTESVYFLGQLLGQAPLNQEAQATTKLIELLAGLPLALRIAGATLRKRVVVPKRIARFVESLRDEQKRLQALQVQSIDELNVEAVFHLSIPLLSKPERATFASLSACIPTDFSLSAAAAAAGLDEDETALHLSSLVNLALVDYVVDAERFRIHTLIYLFAHSQAQQLKLYFEASNRHANYFASYTRKRNQPTKQQQSELILEQAAIIQTARWMVKLGKLDQKFWHGLRQLLDIDSRWQEGIDLIKSYLAFSDQITNDATKAHFSLQLGRYYLRLNDVDAAIESFQKSLTILESSNDPRSIAMVLNSLGGALQNKGQLDAAIEHFQRSLTIGEQLGDQRHIAIVLNSLGSALQRKGQLDRAIEYFQRSFAIREQQGDQRHVAIVLNSLGGALQSNGQVDSAIEYFKRSLAILESNSDQRSMAMVLNSLGRALQSNGQVDSAIEYFKRSLTIEQKSMNQRGIAITLNSLGGALQAKGQLDVAIEHFQHSLAILESDGDQRSIAMVLNSLGGVLQTKGQLDAAIEYFKRSLTIEQKSMNQRGIAITLNSLGGAFQAKGQFDVAIEHFERSLAIAEQQGDRRSMAIILTTLGTAFLRKQQFDKAITIFERVLTVAKTFGDHEAHFIVLNQLGKALQYQGRLNEFMTIVQSSLKTSEQPTDKPSMARILSVIAGILRSEGKYQEAIDMYQRSLKIEESINNQRGIAIVLHSLGETWYRLEQWDKALDAYRRSLAIEEMTNHQRGLVKVLNSLGELLYRNGPREEAIAIYNRSLAILTVTGPHYKIESVKQKLERLQQLELSVLSSLPSLNPPSQPD